MDYKRVERLTQAIVVHAFGGPGSGPQGGEAHPHIGRSARAKEGTGEWTAKITTAREWESPDGSQKRTYLTLDTAPRSMGNLYIDKTQNAVKTASNRFVETGQGRAVWDVSAGGVSGKKEGQINDFVKDLLK